MLDRPISVPYPPQADCLIFSHLVSSSSSSPNLAGFRRARRDGSCFYRCFAFAFIQKILLFNDRPLHHFVTKHLESTLEMLKSVGFEEEVYLEFFNPLKTLLARIHSTDPEVVELDESGLISAFNDEETSNSIVVFLRLVVSAYLKVSHQNHAGEKSTVGGTIKKC